MQRRVLARSALTHGGHDVILNSTEGDVLIFFHESLTDQGSGYKMVERGDEDHAAGSPDHRSPQPAGT
jgi:hypothetical protein